MDFLSLEAIGNFEDCPTGRRSGAATSSFLPVVPSRDTASVVRAGVFRRDAEEEEFRRAMPGATIGLRSAGGAGPLDRTREVAAAMPLLGSAWSRRKEVVDPTLVVILGAAALLGTGADL
jgi:hypothetical protein